MHHIYTYPEDRYLLLGTVVKAQGLRGEVSVFALSGQPETLGHYAAFTLVDKSGILSPVLAVKAFRVQKDRAILLLDRVSDRTAAERLVGMGLLLNKRDLPEPAEGEFYWHELYGLPVRTVAGEQLGTMQAVFSNGAQDVMVISDGDQEHLVPLSNGIIVAQDSSEIVIDPPPGLLAINAEDDGSIPGND